MVKFTECTAHFKLILASTSKQILCFRNKIDTQEITGEFFFFFGGGGGYAVVFSSLSFSCPNLGISFTSGPDSEVI